MENHDSTERLTNQDKLKRLQTGGDSRPSGNRAQLPWETPAPSTATGSMEPTPQSQGPGPSTRGQSPASSGAPSQMGLITPHRQFASMWTRVWCYVIDQVLAFSLGFLIAVVLVGVLSIVGLGPDGALDLSAPMSFLTIITVFLSYFAASYRWWGKTPAMMMGRIAVVDAQEATRLNWGRSYLRSLVLNVQLLIGILTIIWLIVTASSLTKQGPHDRAGHSFVVRAR